MPTRLVVEVRAVAASFGAAQAVTWSEHTQYLGCARSDSGSGGAAHNGLCGGGACARADAGRRGGLSQRTWVRLNASQSVSKAGVGLCTSLAEKEATGMGVLRGSLQG